MLAHLFIAKHATNVSEMSASCFSIYNKGNKLWQKLDKNLTEQIITLNIFLETGT